MIKMVQLYRILDDLKELSPTELDVVYRYIMQHRQPNSFWLIPGEDLKAIQAIMQPVYEQSAHLSDEEIDAIIDESLDEVRRVNLH